MKKLLNNSVSVFVIIIVLLLIIPLSAFVLDMLFIVNIAISLVILLITMYISNALEFSIFPSLLLITTVFRISLNISSTRLILTKQGEAGAVIAAFGKFVIQDNIVVGVLIFLIIFLVQFIVITKGAERVSEVAARFTLDAMPGKQMAIDADLSSGLISDIEAKTRRYNVQRESDFYGAMDGASKFVKGDAILSIIITVINFLAGVIIGLVQGGMTFGEVLSLYSIATIGDGLVSQIPSLLISTSMAMVVTRAVSDNNLNDDVSKQFLSQPTVLIIAGAVMASIVLIPGGPKIQPLIIGSALIALGVGLSSKKKKEESMPPVPDVMDVIEEEFDENAYFRDINNVYSLLNVELIEMEFGYSLIPLVDESSGGNLINRIVIFRRQFAQEMGFVVPSVRLRDSSKLNANQYVIKIKGEEIEKGEILVDYYLALEPPEPAGELDGIDTIEPAYGIPSKWITPDKKEIAEIYGYTVIDPLSVMMTHLSETIKRHAYELLSRTEIAQLIENLKKAAPEVVEEAIPAVISFSSLQKILSNLLKEGVPIIDMGTILETIVESSETTKDIDVITENIRVALKRTITRKFCDNGQLKVIMLDPEVEKTIVSSLARNEKGVYLAMNPDVMHAIVAQIMDYVTKFKEFAQAPIILTSHVIRVYVYRFIEQFYPNIYVLSLNELAGNINIVTLGNITI